MYYICVCVCVYLICPTIASMAFERIINPEEPACSQGILSVVDEALFKLTDRQFPPALGHWPVVEPERR